MCSRLCLCVLWACLCLFVVVVVFAVVRVIVCRACVHAFRFVCRACVVFVRSVVFVHVRLC